MVRLVVVFVSVDGCPNIGIRGMGIRIAGSPAPESPAGADGTAKPAPAGAAATPLKTGVKLEGATGNAAGRATPARAGEPGAVSAGAAGKFEAEAGNPAEGTGK